MNCDRRLSISIWQNNKGGKNAEFPLKGQKSNPFDRLVDAEEHREMVASGTETGRKVFASQSTFDCLLILSEGERFPRIIFYYVLLSNLILLLWHRDIYAFIVLCTSSSIKNWNSILVNMILNCIKYWISNDVDLHKVKSREHISVAIFLMF